MSSSEKSIFRSSSHLKNFYLCIFILSGVGSSAVVWALSSCSEWGPLQLRGAQASGQVASLPQSMASSV